MLICVRSSVLLLRLLQFQCCGANGPNDWLSSRFNEASRKTIAGAETAASAADDKTINMEVSSSQAFYTIPRSCCVHSIDEPACDAARVLPIAAPIDGQAMHLHGCTDKLVSAFQENVSTLFAIALSVLSVELLGLIFSLVLCCSIRKSDYK